MQKLCLYDNEPFEAKRESAKFCTPAHRLKYARENNIDESTGEMPFNPETAGVSIITVLKKGTLSPEDEALTLKANKLGIDLKEYKRRLAGFQKMGLDFTSWISTGIPEFDLLTQIPRGRLTQIEGRYGVGKTTLCLNMIKGLKDKKVLYIDSESSLNPELLLSIGLDDKNFELYNKSAYLEDISVLLRKAVKEGTYDLIILDSVAMTTTRTREGSDITAKDIGQKASILNKTLELTMGDLRRSKTALVFINQTRDKIGTYSPETYTPGGTGVLYNASLMISLKTIKSWRFPKPKVAADKHTYLGHEVEATIIKSKVNTPWRVRKFKLLYPDPEEIEIEPPMEQF